MSHGEKNGERTSFIMREDEGKRACDGAPVFPLQHVVALLAVVVLRPPALSVAARPECVHLDILLQELHIVLSENNKKRI